MEKLLDKRFSCRWSMYFNNRGVKGSVSGKDIIDAIKNRNQNAILIYVEDEDGTPYVCLEHDEVDVNGYYNHFWVGKDGKVLYDENDNPGPPKERPKPIYIGKTETDSGWICPDGKFYECGTEQHTNLADNIVNDKDIRNCEEKLEKKNWIKLSDGEIRYKRGNRRTFTKKQKKTIENYFESKDKKINIYGIFYTFNEFYDRFEL